MVSFCFEISAIASKSKLSSTSPIVWIRMPLEKCFAFSAISSSVPHAGGQAQFVSYFWQRPAAHISRTSGRNSSFAGSISSATA